MLRALVFAFALLAGLAHADVCTDGSKTGGTVCLGTPTIRVGSVTTGTPTVVLTGTWTDMVWNVTGTLSGVVTAGLWARLDTSGTAAFTYRTAQEVLM